MGAIAPMCALLDAKDAKTILVVLDGVANVLAAAEKMGELEKVSMHVEECGGLDRIEALQSHDNVEIYHKSLAILEQYFSTEVKSSFELILFEHLLTPMIRTLFHCSHSYCFVLIIANHEAFLKYFDQWVTCLKKEFLMEKCC